MPAAEAPAGAWRNRIVGHGSEAPDQLLANPRNWRTHPAAQREAIRGALSEVGWVQQVLVNRTTGHLVDGHARVEEALSRGELEVPVTYVELSAEEEALVLATLDPIAAMAESDPERLAALLGEVSVDDEGLRRLLGDLGDSAGRKAGLTDPDDAPDVPDVSSRRRGELWALGDHRLLIGDATDEADVRRLLRFDAVDLVWTDPPYGVSYEGRTEERLRIAGDQADAEALRELLRTSLRLSQLRPGGVFYVCAPSGPRHLDFMLALREAGFDVRQTLIWVKDRFVLGHSDFHYRHEPVLYGELEAADDDAPGHSFEPVAGDGVVDLAAKEHTALAYGWAPGARRHFSGGRRLDTVWEIQRPARSREHPTMKPVDLVARALEYSSRPGDLVYDPFLGSGTTLIAAEQLGRRGRALELDARYAQVAIERWEDFTGRKATLL